MTKWHRGVTFNLVEELAIKYIVAEKMNAIIKCSGSYRLYINGEYKREILTRGALLIALECYSKIDFIVDNR